jgi:hypothetical protein
VRGWQYIALRFFIGGLAVVMLAALVYVMIAQIKKDQVK